MDDAPSDQEVEGDGDRDRTETASIQRLWTPWRMRYVGGETKVAGCIFCDRLAGADDVESLILLRAAHSFVIMNRYPYNTGHVMIVPNAHVPDPEVVAPAALTEMASLVPALTHTLRRVLRCDGFNVGMNVGDVAGAGVAAHLHQHVVPRWLGDANFMPILASTMVLPELLPVTYAKVRAELALAAATEVLPGHAEAMLVVLGPDGRSVLVQNEGDGSRLPRTRLHQDAPVWKAAIDLVASVVTGGVEVAGWAGAPTASLNAPVGLILRTLAMAPTLHEASLDRWRFAHVADAERAFSNEADRVALRRAREQIAPLDGE